MRVENADVPGCGPTHDSAMTLTLISAASASAVIRWEIDHLERSNTTQFESCTYYVHRLKGENIRS